MDKEHARLLFLLLIGLMFFGQAVYDYLKKKSRANGLTKNMQRGQRLSQHKATPAQSGPRRQSAPASHMSVEAKKTEPAFTTATASTTADSRQKASAYVPATNITTEIDRQEQENEPMEADIHKTDNDELRKAVIWSEILRRKF